MNTTPAFTPNYRNAARWLTRQDWKGAPAHWVAQAQIRYQLTGHQSAALLYSMKLMAG